MIALFAGTHEAPFERLIQVADRVSDQLSAEVWLQRGASRPPSSSIRSIRVMSPAQVACWMARADIVVTHGGPALIFEAIEAGHRPIVFPRDPRHGEHVDAHQLAFAERLGERVCLASTGEEVVAQCRLLQRPPRATEGVSAPVSTEVIASIRRIVLGGA